MNRNCRNGGFTLVEFIITIAVASMVTLAATTTLLLGLRIHHKSTMLSAQQNAVSTMYSVMDTIAAESELTVESPASYDANNPQSWKISTDSAVLLEYDVSSHAILLRGAPFVSNISSSHAKLENKLLTITIKTDQDNDYTFSIYCRKAGDAN